jgi:hypothetical protein
MQHSKTPIQGTITNIREHIYIDILNFYVEDIERPKGKTYHEFSEQFPTTIKEAFNIIKNGYILKKIHSFYPKHNIDNIDGMNELYVTSIGANGSDRVFETPHLDGPFCFLPFCTVLRCVLAIQGNKSIITEFPSLDTSFALEQNEFVAFDYNRDVHYIWRDMNIDDNNKRVLLKIHYLVTPTFVPRPIARFYGNIHTKYNQFMRRLFLESQKETALSVVVNSGTKIYCFIYKNLDYVSVIAGSVLLFLIWK